MLKNFPPKISRRNEKDRAERERERERENNFRNLISSSLTTIASRTIFLLQILLQINAKLNNELLFLPSLACDAALPITLPSSRHTSTVLLALEKAGSTRTSGLQIQKRNICGRALAIGLRRERVEVSLLPSLDRGESATAGRGVNNRCCCRCTIFTNLEGNHFVGSSPLALGKARASPTSY